MPNQKVVLVIALALILSSCSALIYAIRGPKYDGKFQQEHYLPVLQNRYYYSYSDHSENYPDSIRIVGNDTTRITPNYSKYAYFFVRYDSDGKIRIKRSNRDTPFERIPTIAEVDKLPVLIERSYVIKDSMIKYEVYMDSYNGYNLYKTRVFNDSVVRWQVGISKGFVETYKPLMD